MAWHDKVDAASLYVSEPDPHGFGNPANPRKDSAWTCTNWLQSRFHFSFAEHRGGRQQFGKLRVMNDDLVQPKRGFGTHGHREMEIVTYVIDGELTHQDSMGTSESLGRGAIQFMSAGTGVRHTEYNHGATPLRFIQMWILPASRGLDPAYGSFAGDAAARKNRLHHVVSDSRGTANTPVKVCQDSSIFVSELDPATTVKFELKAGRMSYLLCMEGGVTVTAAGATAALELDRHAAADIYGPAAVVFLSGAAGTHLLMVEMENTAN